MLASMHFLGLLTARSRIVQASLIGRKHAFARHSSTHSRNRCSFYKTCVALTDRSAQIVCRLLA